MYLFVLVLILTIVFCAIFVAFIVLRFRHENKEVGIGCVIAGILLHLGLIGSVLLGISVFNSYSKKIRDIITLNESYNEFVLGVGNDGEGKAFYYYRYANNLEIRLGKEEIAYSKIIYSNESPCIYEYSNCGDPNVYYNIYVPIDTIIIPFYVD